MILVSRLSSTSSGPTIPLFRILHATNSFPCVSLLKMSACSNFALFGDSVFFRSSEMTVVHLPLQKQRPLLPFFYFNASPGFQHNSSPNSPIHYHLSVTSHIHSSEIFQHIIQPSYPRSIKDPFFCCLLYTSRCV